MTNDRIAAATEVALDALWASVAASFPEATTGDLNPGTEISVREAVRAAVTAWVQANTNTHTHGYDGEANDWTCRECGTLTDYCVQVAGN